MVERGLGSPPVEGGRWVRSARPLSHHLQDHPVLTLDAIARASAEHPPRSVQQHFGDIPIEHRSGAVRPLRAPTETVLTGLPQATHHWVMLKDLEHHAAYRDLAQSVGGGWRDACGQCEAGVDREMVIIFAASPLTVVPAHIDYHHNLLLQIHGTKDVSVGTSPPSEDAERVTEDLVTAGNRNLSHVPAESETFRLGPGDGLYLPPYVPHWIVGGDDASVSFSFGWTTTWSERERLVRYWNRRTRRLGLHPPVPSPSSWRDRAKVGAVRVRGLLG